jgi:hypothetical protein
VRQLQRQAPLYWHWKEDRRRRGETRASRIVYPRVECSLPRTQRATLPRPAGISSYAPPMLRGCYRAAGTPASQRMGTLTRSEDSVRGASRRSSRTESTREML